MTKKLTPEEKAANKEAKRLAKAGAAGATKTPKAKKSPKVVGIKGGKASKKKDKPAGKGHNSGKVNEALKEIFVSYAKLDEDKKAISKAQRDLRAQAKEEHNVSAANFSHEVKLQKLDNDQRVMFETGARDLKGMLGIQLALDLGNGDEEEDDLEGDDPEEAARRAASH